MSLSSDGTNESTATQLIDFNELLSDVQLDEVSLAGVDLNAMPEGSILPSP